MNWLRILRAWPVTIFFSKIDCFVVVVLTGFRKVNISKDTKKYVNKVPFLQAIGMHFLFTKSFSEGMFAKLWQLSRQEKLGNVRLLNTSNLIKIPFETWIPLVYGPSKKLSRFKRAARPATTQLWNSSKVLTDAASVENVRADSSGLVASESFQRFLHNLRLRLWIFLV